MRLSTALDDFLFDLNGYLILKNAVDSGLLARLNAEFDAFPRDLPTGEWYRNARRHDYNADTGMELHNCIEIGAPFEEMIDHPSWVHLVHHYAGEEDSYADGLFIDECIASIRTPDWHHPVHSGGYRGAVRGAFNYKHGVFRCGQVNIILALTDIGEGDGPTILVPGSHKSNLPHPSTDAYFESGCMESLEGAIPIHVSAGDALLFVDGLIHGGSRRTNAGERRVVIYRYGPMWAAPRFGYEYSPELLERLTPERRVILQPALPLRPVRKSTPE